MALRLSSVNRWCVSGTPVQRGLEGEQSTVPSQKEKNYVLLESHCILSKFVCLDLYGLVLFLGVDPYWVKHWWEQLLYRPYRRGNTEPLYNLMGRLLWRSAKKDVIDQVDYKCLPACQQRQVISVH